jgi:phosphoribosylaminoimidazole-succinocarboxamide synthase
MKENITKQLDNTLEKLNLNISDDFYSGKVRENYYKGDQIVMVTSDRVSAFDHILGTIPFKGQILNEIACFWFEKTKDIIPNHFISSPDEQVLVTKKAKTLPVEVIVRQYITGSLWREYKEGINGQYGFMLPDDLVENQKFDKPLLTPSTKAEYGLHDEPISREKIVNSLVDEDVYSKAEEYALKLFDIGQQWANKMGLILVDTKYEFGIYEGELIVIDEIHTPDSSRYWVANEYENRFKNNQPQKMLDKENIRSWLIERGFKGEGTPPKLSDDIRVLLAEKYIELYKTLLGKEFVPSVGDVSNRIKLNLTKNGIID